MSVPKWEPLASAFNLWFGDPGHSGLMWWDGTAIQVESVPGGSPPNPPGGEWAFCWNGSGMSWQAVQFNNSSGVYAWVAYGGAEGWGQIEPGSALYAVGPTGWVGCAAP